MLHAGWRGLAAGIVSEGVRALRELGDQGPLSTAIGPGAGPCCYEVDEAVLEPLRTRRRDWREFLQNDRGSNAQLDLKALVGRQAAESGIPSEHITVVNVCTICHPALFYSYRREGRVNGTMLSGIALVSRG